MAKKKNSINITSIKIFKWLFLIPLIIFFLSIYFFKIQIDSSNRENVIKAKPVTSSPSQASQSAQSSPSSSPPPKFIKASSPQSPQSLTGIPILTYHYIANNPNPKDIARDSLEVPPDKFEEQMEYLSSNGYTPITLDTMYAIFAKQTTAPSKPIVLTFDDGYVDFYTTAFPILRRFNFHAVEFIPTGLIGKSYYMSWDQIKEIQSSGLVTFEDHTVTHANLAGLSYADVLKQMVDSKNVLQSQTGYPVNFIAYPYGITNDSVQQTAKAAGFVGGVGTWYGKVGGFGMNMPRIKVSGFWSLKEFAQRL